MKTSNQIVQRVAAVAILGLAAFSMPALAVIEHSIEYPAANNIQDATLILDDTGEQYTGEVQDEDGRKRVVFVVPDSAAGKRATVNATVDGVPETFSVTIGGAAPVARTGDSSIDRSASDTSWFISGGMLYGLVSSEFATAIAQQSAADGQALLDAQGLLNSTSNFAADDSASALGGMFEVGYRFQDNSRLSLGVGFGSTDEFDINASASGDIPNSTSVVTAESVATGEMDIFEVAIRYARDFPGTRRFGYSVSVGSLSVDRTTSFTSTLSTDGVPIDSISGGDDLDESVIQFGVGIEWTPRSDQRWAPVVGLRYKRSGDLDILDDESVETIDGYILLRFGF